DNSDWQTLLSNSQATQITRPGDVSGNYYYRMRASNQYGSRGWGTQYYYITVIVNNTPPPPPTKVSAPTFKLGVTYVGISWTSVQGATNYDVHQYGEAGSGGGRPYDRILSNIGTVVGGAVSANVQVTAGVYYFAARACNAYGCSAWGEPSDASTIENET